ncbi:hypothetical protein GCM10025771_05150 [Niveibacterium umoris]|uniref:HEAT repeat domain-containing protein n=1 Tax=Niveibacterium umoris TaxID=1193620 RepID=A0A840BUA0_9RHOO|nr:hypothetical protein [Niveibacterium umoris]MBB4013937.1 hypothetical protein [Niveibacterium umoris]
MHATVRLALLVVAALPAVAFAQRKMVWGETEIIGIQRITREQVVSLLPIRLGEEVTQKEKEMLKWCERLKKLPIAAVSCNGAMDRGQLHYIVEILEDANVDFGLQPSTAPRAIGRVPPDVHQMLAHREYRVQEIAAEGYSPGERITPSGVLVADDSELRMYDAQLRDLMVGQREAMVAMALDANHPDRRDAIQLLSWTGNPEASIDAIHARLLDPDTEVRNLTGRFVLSFIERVRDPAVAEALAGSLARAIALPSHADRTKAITALGQLYARHPELRSLLQQTAREPLTRIAKESVIPNVGGEARALLAAIGARG